MESRLGAAADGCGGRQENSNWIEGQAAGVGTAHMLGTPQKIASVQISHLDFAADCHLGINTGVYAVKMGHVTGNGCIHPEQYLRGVRTLSPM